MTAAYQSRVSEDSRDPSWREFLREAPGGHYMQGAEWAEFKRAFSWSVVRLTISRGEDVHGGVQILRRRLPAFGSIGWAPKAPVLRDSDPELVERLLDELQHLVKRDRIRILMLQPASDRVEVLDALSRRGFEPSPVLMAPRATILIDLDADIESIEGQMRSKTRQHIRKGLREGVTVREGNESDLDTFYRLHVATGRRQGFSPYPQGHFTALWQAFRPVGGVRLFLAECNDEPVSGLILLIHGDTVYTHAMGWSGRHARLMANEVLYWSAIKWSKAHAYRTWDFTWIDPRAGDALAHGQPLPEDLRKSVTFFKLGFGGTVTTFPGAYDYVANAGLRAAFHSLFPPVYRLNSVRKAQRRLRWHWVSRSHGVPGNSLPSGPAAT